MSEEAHRRGAHAYLEKGTAAPEIVAALERLCDADLPPAPPATADEAIWGLIHELSAPVTAIIGFADAVDDDAVSDEQSREFLAGIRRNGAHLRRLLQSVNDARRVDIAALDLDRRPVDVATLVRETVADVRHITAGHPVEVRADEHDVTAAVDETRVRQILINLISNAAKFSDPDAPIEIDVVATPERVEVAVADRGRGISRVDELRLFRKFSRLEHGGPGTGLGLYISRGIARAHGGDLELESSGPEGSRFRLWLPLV